MASYLKFCTNFGSHIRSALLGVSQIPAIRNFNFAETRKFSTNIVNFNLFERNFQSLLIPTQTTFIQTAGFKVKAHLTRRCKDCYMVVRQQRAYIICPTHPRHKQMQMKKRDYKSWILTHATQSKVRPY